MKQYIKWFAKLLLLALILVIVDFGVGRLDNYVFKVDSKSNPDYLTNVSKLQDEIIIVGSSTANHHYISQRIQDSLGMSVYNAGLDGAFFIFQNCVINYLMETSNPSYIIWEIGEDCLSDNMPQSREYQKMAVLYPYYDNEYIHTAVDNRDNWQRYRMKSNVFRDNSSMIHDVLTSVNSIWRKNSNDSNIADSVNKGYRPLPNTGYDYPDVGCDSVAEFVNTEKVLRLRNTIHACKEKGIQIIFTSSPRHYDADLLSLKQVGELKRIAIEENVPYLDFYSYKPIALNDSLFKDCDHLNERGAEAYMDVFIPALRSEILKLSN